MPGSQKPCCEQKVSRRGYGWDHQYLGWDPYWGTVLQVRESVKVKQELLKNGLV